MTVVLIAGCCDKKTRQIQPYWLSTPEGYELSPVTLSQEHDGRITQMRVDLGKTTGGDPFNGADISGFIFAQQYGFWLDVTNDGHEPIRILWTWARYVDELGNAHTVYAQQRGALPDNRGQLQPPPAEFLGPGERSRPTIVPIYKQYLVAGGCRDLYPYSEPLVPTRLDDKDEQQMKAYVEDLAKRKVPVKLLLPIEIDGNRYDYTFTFVLRPRWATAPDK